MLRLTRWTMAHRRTVVVAWIAAAVALLAGSQAIGSRTSNDFSLPGTSSQRAVDLLQSRFAAQAGDADQIVFRARAGTVTAPQVRRVVTPLLARIDRLPHVTGVVSPYAPGAQPCRRTARSRSRRSSSTSGPPNSRRRRSTG